MSLLDLLRPKWRHSDWRVRQAALKDCSKQVIAQAALNDESLHVALTAVGMLSDDAALADIARKATHSDVRLAAVHAVREQLVLGDIAMTAPDKKVRETAMARIFAVSVLASIATRADQEHLSAATSALAKIHDREVLRQIAASTAHPHVRASAVACLRDQVLLATIVRAEDHPAVRAAAAARLTDQQVLKEIAVTDTHEGVRQAAVSHITDQSVLETIARTDPHVSVRRAAVGLLADREVLEQFAVNDADEDVQDAACRRLEKVYEASPKEGHLPRGALDAILTPSDVEASMSALSRFIASEQPVEVLVLTGVAVLSEHPEVRQCALKRLLDRGNEERLISVIRSWRDSGALMNLAGPMNAEHRMRAAEIESGAVRKERPLPPSVLDQVEMLIYCWSGPSPGRSVENQVAQQLLDHLSHKYRISRSALEFREGTGYSQGERTDYFIAAALLKGVSKDRLGDALTWHVDTPSGPASYFLILAS